jgi:hypothetical protein
MKKFLGFIVAACLLAPVAVQAMDTAVGSIKMVRGTSAIMRDMAAVSEKRYKVFRNDILKTGSDDACR